MKSDKLLSGRTFARLKLYRRFSFLAAIILLVSLLLVACGSDTPTATPAASTNNATTTSSASTTTSTSTTDTQATATPVVMATAATAPANPTVAATGTAVANATAVPTTAATAGSNSTASAGTSGNVPRFESGNCPFNAPTVVTGSYQCGYVIVPELHSQPNGKTIKLAVIDFKATGSNPAPDPVFYFDGGPGGHIQDTIDFMDKDFYQAFAGHQDAIFFDQRGAGKSVPELGCPEVDTIAVADANKHLSLQQSNTDYLSANQKCHDRLVGQGINLSAYNSIENAEDVNDIRVALGYQKMNIYGVSYGTLLAETVLRLFPSVTRSVVLDSVVPPTVNFNITAIQSTSRSFTTIFNACAADATCNSKYPNLPQILQKTYDTLNQKLPTVTATDPETNKNLFPAVVDGPTFIAVFQQLLYASEFEPLLPAYLYAIYNGRYDILAPFLSSVFQQNTEVNIGMYNSVECSEAWPFTNEQNALTADKGALPELTDGWADNVKSDFQLCSGWHVASVNPAQHTLVKSDVPTLILEGQVDPITPPQYGQMVQAQLSKSYYAEFPGRGHGEVLPGNTCGINIMSSFLNDPNTKPDTSCTSQLSLSFK